MIRTRRMMNNNQLPIIRIYEYEENIEDLITNSKPTKEEEEEGRSKEKV